MQVSCPNCKEGIDVADERLAAGVAKVRCDHCSFGFTIRLGDPNAPPPEEDKDPAEPIKLEGVKASGDLTEAAGEIGEAPHKFISSETCTLVRVDTTFERQAEEEGAEIEKYNKEDQPEPQVEEAPEAEEQDPAAKATLLDYPAPALEPAKKQEIRPALVDEPTLTENQGQDDGDQGLISRPTEPEMDVSPLKPEPALELEPEEEPADIEPEPEPALEVAGPAPEAELVPEPEAEPEPAPEPEVEPAPPPIPELTKNGIPQGLPTARHSAPYATIEIDEDALIPDDFILSSPEQGKGMRTLGVVITIAVGLVAMLFFFVLIRNDWSLDMANFDTMINHAFGLDTGEEPSSELRGLQVSIPLLEKGKLSSGDSVILAQGTVKNNDTRARRFIYVKVTVSRHGRPMVSGTAPAGNIFSGNQLAKLTKAEMLGRITSRGQDGSNARIESGRSVDFMVVLTRVPHDFSPASYTAAAEVTEAEVPLD